MADEKPNKNTLAEPSPLRTLLEWETGLTTIYCPACHAERPMGGKAAPLDHLEGCPLYGA